MKANELRIGNFVDLYGSVATVIRFDFNDRPPCGLAVDHGKPIPLTEEWLRRFGFTIKWESYGWEAALNNFYLWKGMNWDYWEYATVNDRDNNCNEVNVSLNYVHQLQNLYFALTSEELEIKS